MEKVGLEGMEGFVGQVGFKGVRMSGRLGGSSDKTYYW